ncbi:MAG: IS3 family transposase, partial [Paludibacteraceae bacterium]|nr:IS3 family transposase [Paludibacteraceae bacterium]MBO5817774.1 IS3 family transposase [Paludibacteraceae bacterium]
YNNDRIKLRLNMSPVQYRQNYMNNMSMNMHTINNIY